MEWLVWWLLGWMVLVWCYTLHRARPYAMLFDPVEVGYPEAINFFKYVPVDWTAKPDVYKEYQHLISLYNEHPALRKGKMTAWPDDDVLIFEKTDDTESFLILVNVRNETETKRAAN